MAQEAPADNRDKVEHSVILEMLGQPLVLASAHRMEFLVARVEAVLSGLMEVMESPDQMASLAQPRF